MSREPAVNDKQTIWRSFPLQLLASLIAGAVLPSLFFIDFLTDSGIATQGVYASIVAAAFACILGTTLQRRVTAFPGTRELSYILPSYMSSYAIALAAIVVSRLNYNRPFLILSVTFSVATAFILSFYSRRHSRRRFHVVPFGEVDVVTSSPEADWIFLTRPVRPSDVNAIIVADLKFDHAPEWERMLAEAAIRGHVVYHTKQLCESLTGRVSIDHLSENSFGSLVPNLAYVKSKRVIDLTSALLLMPVLAPIFAVIAVLIKLDSAGPVFFRQRRMGYRGHHFSMIKFRTMHPRPPVDNDHIDDAMTTDNDSRVTKIGRFLRRARIDELPQVFNIIRGEMSWIGPRPEAIILSEWYDREIPFYVYRHIVRPGITGWAQVNQGHVTDITSVTEKLAYDFYYIKCFSFWIDILISLRTVKTIVNGFGAK
jgi:lipopolysaccharide/colanic/teichoic acid biosynthesis glycosyltransferase